jgi:Uma2 family endonuclease
MTDYLTRLNAEQRTAVETVNSPLLVFAGTGKTRVLKTRSAHVCPGAPVPTSRSRVPRSAGMCYVAHHGRSSESPRVHDRRRIPRLGRSERAAWQLIDGVPQAMAAGSGTHALIQGDVCALIGSHLAAHCPGCRVLSNPGVIPRLDSEDNFRIPDRGVTCTPIPRRVIEIAEPVLLIEVLSPGNPVQTWTNVWAYTSIPSVQEILVIRTASIGVQLLRRAPDASWPDVPLGIQARTRIGEHRLSRSG